MLPQHEEAELAIAGALLVRGDWTLAQIADLVSVEDFASPVARTIFAAALELWRKREPVDVVTIEAQLRAVEQLKLVDGVEGLGKLQDRGGLAGVEAYARRVRDLARARRLVLACRDVVQGAEGAIGAPSGWLEEQEARLFEVTRRGESRTVADAAELARIVYQDLRAGLEGEPLRALSTGFLDLDARLGGGLRPGNLVIVAGRASMGKTAFVLNLLARASVMRVREWVLDLPERPRKQPSLMFSLEMDHLSLAQRLAAFEARVSFKAVQQRTLDRQQFDAVANALPRVELADLLVDVAGGVSLVELRARARRWRFDRRRFPEGDKSRIGLVVVDYLQLMRSLDRSVNREQQVAEQSKGLKELAKELETVVVVLAQLNRAPDNREDHRPQLGDLRESGSIEQDADVVLFPYRESYYKKDATPDELRKAEIIVGKARNGTIGSVPLAWFGDIQTFGDSAWRP